MREFSDEYNNAKKNACLYARAEKLDVAMRKLQKTQLWSQYVPAKPKAGTATVVSEYENRRILEIACYFFQKIIFLPRL